MPLKIGEKAPDFTLQSTNGKTFTLSKVPKGKPIIIYFYPKDFSQTCTKEACEFSESYYFFNQMDVDVYGISRDDIGTHHEFRKTFGLKFHLLSDTDGKVAELYKAAIPLINFTRRVTYLLDKDHNIAAAYENFFGAKKHISNMIEGLKKSQTDKQLY